jgi:hypothetical protein
MTISDCDHGSLARYIATLVIYCNKKVIGMPIICTIEGTISAPIPVMNVNSIASGTSGRINKFATMATFEN